MTFSRIVKSVILCGGSGTRLWPLSRESFPKQFVPLIEGKSLLELTLDRVKSLGSAICVTNEEHRFFVQDLLPHDSQSENSSTSILLEPTGRNTAAAMASSALMPGVSPSDILLFLPSDHFVPDIDAFVSTIDAGIAAAKAGFIVTFGVQPSFPSTAYGYIQRGDSLDLVSGKINTYAVKRFEEKPVLDKAHAMLLSGNYLWNAGIFLCTASTLLEALVKHAPDILSSCQQAMQNPEIDGHFVRPNKESFLSCRSESIDSAVMEHFDRVAVVPFKGAWSDVGSWNAVADLTPEDQSGNRVSGQGMTFQSNNTYINAPHRPVIALGTSDLVIVDTPDAVLVASVDKVEQVKEVVAALKKAGQSQAVTHRKVARPWGWYDSIDMGEHFQVKRIAVKPGASLSLQMHHHRAEHWIVVKGTAKVTNGDQVFLLEENQSTYIPISTKHRLENPGKTDLEMIEVQSGSYLSEDDIIRFEDSYGRS
uniref:mannose-1-phosphate guanylyltransferase/mannose-6-phosphate isomerase n=1 Tax=Polynucleobacter sp. TaxID=2029855 RepID=UPI0040470F12